MNITEFIRDDKFCQILDEIDKELVIEAQKRRCNHNACRSVLDRADYPRKVDPSSVGNPSFFARMYALCCRNCRRRVRVSSVRFVGRVRTVLPLFLLASLFLHSLTGGRIGRLKKTLAVGETTIRRWRAWFVDVFPKTKTVRRFRGLVPGIFSEEGVRRYLLPMVTRRDRPMIALLLQEVSGLNQEMCTFHDGLSPPAENG